MADIIRLNRDMGMEILGARGMLHTYEESNRAELAALTGGSRAMAVTGTSTRRSSATHL